jgi:anti-sigma B factor antagonist
MSPANVAVTAPPTADLPVTITVHADDAAHSATIVLSGDLDLAAADTLAATIAEQHRRARRYVRLDLADVTFLDATALGVLVDAHREFLARRGTLTLTGVGRPVSRLLAITGLDKMLFVAGPRSPLTRPAHALPTARLRRVAV